MHLALLGDDHPYHRRLRAAWHNAGHTVSVTPDVDATLLVDGRALAAWVPRLRSRPFTALVHHPDPSMAPFLAMATRVIATGAPVGARLQTEFGLPEQTVLVVEPGVDDIARAAGSGTGAILAVGSLIPRKGHDVLIAALARLFDLDWSLTIAGDASRDPEHAAALAELVRSRNLEQRVHFAGALDDAALDALWHGSDMFALATRWEGHSAAVAQALACGLPVAVTTGGEAAALVTSSCAVVCPPDDVDGLSKAMRRVLFDGELRAHMAQAAWTRGQSLPRWPAQAALVAAALG